MPDQPRGPIGWARQQQAERATSRRRPTARELLTPASEQLLATAFAGQVRAVVIERALKRMAAADQKAARQASEGKLP